MISRRKSRWIVAAVSVLYAALLGVAVVCTLLDAGSSPPVEWGTAGGVKIFLLSALAFPAVGAAIALRQPANAIGWLCLGIGLALVSTFAADAYGSYGRAKTSPSLPAVEFAAWLQNWSWVVWVGTAGTFLILLFPDGRLPSRRWRPVAWFSAAVIVLACVSAAFRPGPLSEVPGVENPYGVEAAEDALLHADASFSLLPLCFLASAATMVLRFRRTSGRERLQIKWFAFAGAVWGGTAGLTLASKLILELLEIGDPLAQRLMEDAVSALLAGLPIAAGIAILRHRLYDIDIVINRTLVYGSLTALLAGTYLGAVLLLGLALGPVTEGNELAVAVSTLAVAALFRPARRRIQDLVDRRFYRRKYDAERTLAAFSARLRDEVELEALAADLRAVVRETVQPAHVSLWLRATPGGKQ